MTATVTIAHIATLCFALAILHTFCVKFFQKQAHKYPEGSVGENLFHLLGEVEVVFGLWAGIFLLLYTIMDSSTATISYVDTRNFTEPIFIFAIMTVCASQPILFLAEKSISLASRLIPIQKNMAFYFSTLTVGPILGSLITEPAAMTVTALVLLKYFYKQNMTNGFRYATIGLLFVNVSIGGTFTPYAAPPVLMVAPKWGWDLTYMFTHFGWKAGVAIVISTILVLYRFRKEIKSVQPPARTHTETKIIPAWVILSHLTLLVGIVMSAHHVSIFMGLFLFFLGLANVTKEYQTTLKLKEGLLVGFFLGGLVVLGGFQSWWLAPLLARLDALPLFLGSSALTAIVDNAAITYLGSQISDLTELSKFALVAGSVVGGGLTVIANAPNPAGYGILNPTFGKDGISPIQLLLNAMPPTLIAGICFWFL